MPEERKLVTILFADVTDSTSLGDTLDPEDVRALMTRYYDHARHVVSVYGGTLEKFNSMQLERARPVLEKLGDRQFLRRLEEVKASMSEASLSRISNDITRAEANVGTHTGL